MIPRETSKELVVSVENESISVAMSPPVLDAVIVQGVAPEQNPDTVLVSGYDPISTNLFLRTMDGREFSVYNVDQDVAGSVNVQVEYGAGNPSVDGLTGQLYINTSDNSIWAWT